MMGRYNMRFDADGWTVYDARTGETLAVDGREMRGLSMEQAGALVHGLNSMAAGESAPERATRPPDGP